MEYSDAKVYFDGSHYIAIPKVEQPWKKRKKQTIKTNQVLNENNLSQENKVSKTEATRSSEDSEIVATAKVDLKMLFETLYIENLDKKHTERKEEIKKVLKNYIENEERLNEFVKVNLERKKRNLIERRKRFARKVYLQEWSYFCTFTYDDKKHTEDTFKKKLSNCLKHLSSRKGWKYAGVWERSPQNNRLHFHALVYVPNNDLEFIEVKDYSTKTHKMQTTYQNKYFLDKFGRNDFDEINQHTISQSIAYIMKYLGKTEERVVYSKGLPTYFLTDILECDIICTIGQEDRKLLLYDDFYCLDEGVLIGKASKETISQLRKTN